MAHETVIFENTDLLDFLNRPTWELQEIVRALSRHKRLNDLELALYLYRAKAELKARGEKLGLRKRTKP